MQKLAVALTTQEECEIYNNWRGEQGRYKYTSEFFSDKVGLVIVHDRNGAWGGLDWHIRNGYKIISLQEAIGEKEESELVKNYNLIEDVFPNTLAENKEIIREGEAEGLEYKHKKLGRIAFQDDEDTRIVDRYNDGGDFAVNYKELIALGFEPIEEPKREWVSNMKDDLKSESKVICTDFGDGVIEAVPFEYIREAIEKHMPPQRKFTCDEVRKFAKKRTPDSITASATIQGFLDEVGLLIKEDWQ